MKREEDYKLIDELLAEVPEVEIPEDLHFDASLIMKLAEEEKLQRKEIRVTRAKNPRRMRMIAGLCASFVVLAGVTYFGLNNLRMGGMKSEAPLQAVDSIAPAEGNEYKAETGQPCYKAESTPLTAEDRNQADSLFYGLGEEDLRKIQAEMDEHPDWYELLWAALENESFAEEFKAANLGYGFYICELTDTAESVEFMIYFYPEAGKDNLDCNADENAYVRSILWKKK